MWQWYRRQLVLVPWWAGGVRRAIFMDVVVGSKSTKQRQVPM